MELDYRQYESQYGVMYHLLIDKLGVVDGVKYVNGSDILPKFLVSNGKPLFFNYDKEFCKALEYTIIFPKIYVKKSILLEKSDISEMSRNYIH